VTTLRTAVVLEVAEESCRVVADGRVEDAAFLDAFPRPRVERVSPGHLVALAGSRVVWRWYDAVVLEQADDTVTLYEPAHGTVTARPRTARDYRPGSRAWLSAGLPGADWWVASPTCEPVDVDVAEVVALFEHWGVPLG
jgi:hypothetical protein